MEQKQRKLFYVLLILGCISHFVIAAEVNSKETQPPNNTTGVPKTVKKELKLKGDAGAEGNITAEKVVQIGPGSVVETKNSNEQKVQKGEQEQLPQQVLQKGTEKTGIISNATQTTTGNKTALAPKSSTAPATSTLNHFHHQEESILNSEEEISDSLKTGFYFFVALSVSALMFIVFKVYRLRLSRAERKYGVQGDRSTQELTPLPIAMEDGNSDDEDQTLFEVQRQNIRIL